MTGSTHAPTDGTPTIVVGGRYRLVGELGRGGMATVHRAVDEVLGREVALKLLHPHLTADRRVLDRFRREARAAASVQHPGVVQVHDWGIDGSTPYLVMELVEGRSLRTVLDLRGRLRPGEVLSLLAPAVAGLGAAHAAGVVHRDVTPANLLIAADGASRIGDFGLARSVAATSATFTDTIVGSPHYLSPEAARGQQLTPRSDVYSLGCVLFECLTGSRPFDGDSPIAVAARHGVDLVPVPSSLVPGLSTALDEVVRTATAHDPDDRFEDGTAFAAALAAAIPEGPAPVDLRDGTSTTVVSAEHATRVLDEVRPDDEAPGGRGVLARLGRLLLWLVLLGALLGGAYAGWDRFVAPVTAVPDVTGLVASEARAQLEDAGFEVAVEEERVTHPTIPDGAVVSQSPADSARRTSTIHLTLSAGPRTGTLPPLVGRDVEDAVAAIEALDLDLTVTTEDAHDDVQPVGVVLAATPAGGDTVAERGEVVLTVSVGPAPVDVPDVTGRLQADATAELVGLGLTASVVERRFDDSPEGTVIGTTPPAGTTLRRGDDVGLVVSDGPEPVEVPDVVGMRESAAIRRLEQAGFVVEVRYVQSLLPFAAGVVDAQDPDPGTTRRRGDTVRIFVWQ